MKTIHKYALITDQEDKIVVMMPLVAKVVMVGSQDGQAFPLGHRELGKPPGRAAFPPDRHRPTDPRGL